MRAVTLHQPWATLIAVGAKTIETRSWPAPKSIVGERIAIHAAKNTRELEHLARTVKTARTQAEQAIVEALKNADVSIWADMPLGSVVATAVVSESLRMVEGADEWGEWPHETPSAPKLSVDPDGTLTRWRPDPSWKGASESALGTQVTDQKPFGHFEPGRWAWMLEDVKPFAMPIPARGMQGVWHWDQPTVPTIETAQEAES